MGKREKGAQDGCQVFLTWAGGWVGCIEGTGGQRSGVGGDLTQMLRRELGLYTVFQGVLSCLPALRINENWVYPKTMHRKCMCFNARRKRWEIVGILWSQTPKIIPKLNSSYPLFKVIPGVWDCGIFYLLYFSMFSKLYNICIWYCKRKQCILLFKKGSIAKEWCPASHSPLYALHAPGTAHFVPTHLCAFAYAVPSAEKVFPFPLHLYQ